VEEGGKLRGRGRGGREEGTRNRTVSASKLTGAQKLGDRHGNSARAPYTYTYMSMFIQFPSSSLLPPPAPAPLTPPLLPLPPQIKFWFGLWNVGLTGVSGAVPAR